MMRILTTTLCLLAMGGLYAEAAAVPTPEQRAERREKALNHLKEKHPEVFKKMDSNGDGEINGGEFHTFLDQRDAKFQEKYPEVFAGVDTNGDGKLSQDEMKVAREAREERFKANHPKAFDRVDKNDDGELQRREVHKAREAREKHKEKHNHKH